MQVDIIPSKLSVNVTVKGSKTVTIWKEQAVSERGFAISLLLSCLFLLLSGSRSNISSMQSTKPLSMSFAASGNVANSVECFVDRAAVINALTFALSYFVDVALSSVEDAVMLWPQPAKDASIVAEICAIIYADLLVDAIHAQVVGEGYGGAALISVIA